MNLHALAAKRPRGVPGLPAYHPPQSGLGIRRGASVGATRTAVNPALAVNPATMPVSGAPSMKMTRRQNGGVVVSVKRGSRWTEFLSDAEMRALEKIAANIEREAVSLSQGPLHLRRLAAMGHPYGRGPRTPRGRKRRGLGRLQGARRGVSNLAVANRQSGELARSWKAEVHRSKNGIEIVLSNDSPHAPYLALGTVRMKAHGPFTTAPARHLAQLNREWARVTRAAQHRALALASITGGDHA